MGIEGGVYWLIGLGGTFDQKYPDQYYSITKINDDTHDCLHCTMHSMLYTLYLRMPESSMPHHANFRAQWPIVRLVLFVNVCAMQPFTALR